jgi:hypothetical protein
MDTPTIDINELFGEDGYSAPTEPIQEKQEEQPPKEEVAPPPAEEEEEEEETERPSLHDFLLKAGVLSEDPGDVDEETLLDIVQQETEQYLEEALTATFDNWKQKLPSNVMGLIQHTFNGGNPDEYMKAWTESPLQSFDIETEAGQEAFLRYYYKTVEKLDSDEIEDKMDYHLDRGNAESVSKRYFKRMAEDRDKKLEQLAKAQIDEQRKAKEANEQRKAKMAQGIGKVKEFAGYKFPDGEIKVLTRYATQPVVVEGKAFSSGLAADLYEALNDPAKVAFLSKLLKNDFKTDFLESKAKSTVVKKIKQTLQEPAIVTNDDGVIWD